MSGAADALSGADPRAATEPVTVEGEGIVFTGLRCRPTGEGPGSGREAVLLHVVQSSAATMARTARALAADGWAAIALDRAAGAVSQHAAYWYAVTQPPFATSQHAPC